MLDYVVNLLARLGHWSYAAVFLGAMLESAALLGLLVPGEALVLAAGFFAAQGVLDLDALIWTVAAGALLGDSLGYEMGRYLGRAAALRYGGRLGLTEQRLDRAERFFARHGGASVFLGRFVGFARALVPFLAGASRMPYRRFLPWNAVGSLAWASIAVLLGYLLGNSWHRAEAWVGHASALLAGALLLGWLLRERRRWQAVVPLEAVALVVCVCLFGAIAEDVVTGDPLTRIDQQLAVWLQQHRIDPVTRLLLAWTRLHNPLPFALLSAALGLWWLWRREWRWLATLVLAVPGGALLNVALKHLFQRARPVLDEPLLALHTFSFPSGHVTGATLLYGLLCAYALVHLKRRCARVAAVTAALSSVLMVAISRMYLGAHFLSDVLGAFAEAVAWLTLSLALVQGRLGAPVRDRVLERLGSGIPTLGKKDDERNPEDAG